MFASLILTVFVCYISVIDNHYGRKGRGLVYLSILVLEPKSSTYKSDFGLSIYEVMEICCICSGRDQQNDGCSFLSLFPRLADPLSGLPSIGRIAEYRPPRNSRAFPGRFLPVYSTSGTLRFFWWPLHRGRNETPGPICRRNPAGCSNPFSCYSKVLCSFFPLFIMYPPPVCSGMPAKPCRKLQH